MVCSISYSSISMPDGPSCQLTVYSWHLMREWRHHCQKIATRDRIMSGGNTGWNRKQSACRSWSMWGSNSRPWRYQHHALPTELTDQDDGACLVCRPSNSTLIEVEESLFWGAGGKGRESICTSTELFSNLGQVMLPDPLGGVGICRKTC